jgi:formylglycine-generating enzyme required for sulfatase activity
MHLKKSVPPLASRFKAGALCTYALTSLAIGVAALGGAGSAAAQGMVIISSNPRGMPVYVNGVRKGVTPTSENSRFRVQLKAGEYTVEVRETKGREECVGSETVTVVDDGVHEISLKSTCGPIGQMPPTYATAPRAAVAAAPSVAVPSVVSTARPAPSPPVASNSPITAPPITAPRPVPAAVRPSPTVTRERAAALAEQIGQQMVALTAGSFQMGSASGSANERPTRVVQVASFDISRYEVSFDQWDACFDAGACAHRPYDQGWGRGKRPVIHVSWEDAQQFIAWLNTGLAAGAPQAFRLPTEAEWEYAARAGSAAEFASGKCLSADAANYDANFPGEDCPKGEFRNQTLPVGSLSANAFHLHDMHGNVSEWVQDCWNASYNGAPATGEAWATGDCKQRVGRGGTWFGAADDARSALRRSHASSVRFDNLGFRLARSR